jgi:DNA-binding transcriptional LysR family regulator
MELRHLRYFVKTAEMLHFGRAAEALNIAQPALSQQIQQLEQEVGVLLFKRSRRSVALTRAGETFLREARRTLTQSELAALAAQRAERGEVGRIVIGFISSAAYTRFTKILRLFRNAYPGVQLLLDESTTEQQLRALRQSRIDLGVIRPPLEAATTEGLTMHTLIREHIVAVVSDYHPLAKAESIALEQLAGDAFITLPRRMIPGFYDQIIGVCRAAGFVPRIAHEARQIQTIVNLVAADLGVALAPASLRKAQRRGVRYIPLAGDAIWTELQLLHRSDDDNPIVQAFVECALA